MCADDCAMLCRMADDDLDIEAMLEAPYVNGVSYCADVCNCLCSALFINNWTVCIWLIAV